MSEHLIARISCAIGFHKMPKWDAVECGTVTKMTGVKNIYVQRRTCAVCGAIKTRIAV